MDDIIPGIDLCMFPAALPPDGTVINFDNPEDLVAVLISVCVVVTVLSIVFTILRLVANRRRLGLSDCTNILEYASILSDYPKLTIIY
jgi:hypothetical protein